jgi:hypothetical protein
VIPLIVDGQGYGRCMVSAKRCTRRCYDADGSPTCNGGRCDGVERVSGSGASAVSVITAKLSVDACLANSREAKTRPSPRVIIVRPKQLAGALSLGEDRHRAFGFEQRQSNHPDVSG